MNIAILALGALIFLAHLFGIVFQRTRVPDVLLLIVLGVLLGPVAGVVRPEAMGQVGQVLSGLALWFATEAMAVMPKWAFDLLAVLHGRESVVIFLVLFLWHLYDVHLRPEVFPMDWSWITGRISLADLQERHPLEYERLRKAGVLDGER